ncbi:MAG: hypothetical protein AAF380_03480 [Bacteroidota bacterium]
MNEPLFLKKKSPSKEEAEKLAQLYNHEAEASFSASSFEGLFFFKKSGSFIVI